MADERISEERLNALFGWAEAQILRAADRWNFADIATAISELLARRAAEASPAVAVKPPLSLDSLHYLHAILASDTRVEAAEVWDRNPEERKAALAEVHAALSHAPLPAVSVTEEVIEIATMTLLGHDVDRSPGIDWPCNRQWTVNDVRKRMRAALTAAFSQGEGNSRDEVLEDVRSHLRDWRDACLIAQEHAEVSPPDIDDKLYWQHQIDVIDRLTRALEGALVADESISEKLKPCPFCGGPAELVIEHDHAWIRHGQSDCGLSFEGGYVDGADAIAAWNSRAAEASPAVAANCEGFIADPSGSAKCAACGRRRQEHGPLSHAPLPAVAVPKGALTVEQIVERIAWYLCYQENEVWDEASDKDHRRWRREAAQSLVPGHPSHAALSHAPLPAVTVTVTEERVQAGVSAMVKALSEPLPDGVAHYQEHAVRSILTAALSQGEGNSRDEALESAAQIAGDACWSLPMPKHWDRDKDEYSDWCAAQSKFMREKILALKSPPQPLATHRHKKRGTEYVLIGFGKMQTQNWIGDVMVGGEYTRRSVDMREVAICRDVKDGSLWVRPREEFEDDRFEALPPSQPQGDARG